MEAAMSHKEFLKFKAAAEKIERECNTPEKAGQFLIKIGYLNPDGQVAEKYR
jgi:hypothetical protein